MTARLLLLAVSGTALIAFAVSLAVAACIPMLRRRLDRVAPSAQARVLLVAALAPAFVAFAVQAGWAIHFHLIDPSPQHAQHDCPIPLTPLLAAGVLLLVVRLVVASARTTVGAWRSYFTLRSLRRASVPIRAGFDLFATAEPTAFVAGLLRPRVFLSRGLLAAVDQHALAAILAHETAHARRRDPLRRLLSALVLAFHLPGVAQMIDTLLARAHECVADADAARKVGDGPRVAQTLIQVARLRLAPAPASAHSAAILGSDLDARVRHLLAVAGAPDAPSVALLAAGAAGVVVLSVAFAVPLHAAAELAVSLLPL